MYEKYSGDLVVLGFPCNQFGGQEPATDSEIKKFATSKYGVTFPMFSKIDVKGKGAHPVYKFLETGEDEAIRWNFFKFLVDKDGNKVKRYAGRVKPKDLEGDIEALLG